MNMDIDIDIIDDEEGVNALFAAVASDVGFTTRSYYSAEQYLEYANSTNYKAPDLAVVTDVQMPGKTGYELMTELHKINKTQRFVVITGTPGEKVNTEVNACFYLTKPVDVEKLQTVFSKLKCCKGNNIKCLTEDPHCITLSNLSAFNITDWRCPLKDTTK